MKKSVYSLVLMDEIVASIDELAYSLNTSRSNLINQILAEKVALVTPEQQLQLIINELAECHRPYHHFQIQAQASDHMYSIKSALKYKYNPTIRYAIYLGKVGGELTGEIRVISRTQSEGLSQYLSQFFTIWATLEKQKRNSKWEREEGVKWVRTLNLTEFQQPKAHAELAEALSHYIGVLDHGLKLYFPQFEITIPLIQTSTPHFEAYQPLRQKNFQKE